VPRGHEESQESAHCPRRSGRDSKVVAPNAWKTDDLILLGSQKGPRGMIVPFQNIGATFAGIQGHFWTDPEVFFAHSIQDAVRRKNPLLKQRTPIRAGPTGNLSPPLHTRSYSQQPRKMVLHPRSVLHADDISAQSSFKERISATVRDEFQRRRVRERDVEVKVQNKGYPGNTCATKRRPGGRSDKHHGWRNGSGLGG